MGECCVPVAKPPLASRAVTLCSDDIAKIGRGDAGAVDEGATAFDGVEEQAIGGLQNGGEMGFTIDGQSHADAPRARA